MPRIAFEGTKWEFLLNWWRWWKERGARIWFLLFGPLLVAAVAVVALLSPLTYQRESAESRFLAAILLIGIASAVAYSAFLICRERIKNRFLLLWILVITPLLTIPALRLLFIASGEIIRGEHYRFLVLISLGAVVFAFFFLAFYRWAEKNKEGAALAALLLLPAALLVVGGSLARAVDYRKEAVRYYNKGEQAAPAYRVEVGRDSVFIPGPEGLFLLDRERLTALDPADGAERWVLELKELFPRLALEPGGAFVGDRLLIYSRDTIETANDEEILAYLVDPLSGEAVKPLSVPARLPAVTGKVYLTGQLFGEGKLIYTVAEDRDSGSCLVRAIAVDGGTVWEQWYEQPLGRFLLLDGALLSRVGRELWCLDLDQGTRRWSIELGEAYEALAAYDPALYLGGNRISALDIWTGTLIWERSSNDREDAVSSLAVLEQVIAGLSGGRVAAYGRERGDKLWEVRLEKYGRRGTMVFSSARDGRFWAGSPRGALYLMSPEDGTIFWRFRGVDLSPIRSLCEGEGRVYYLAGRYLYALDLKEEAR
jgi:outer membrane protein assembly factor BamB